MPRRHVPPLKDRLKRALAKLKKKDEYEIFFYPVSKEDAPQYYDIITNPMDFSTMEQKILDNKYSNVDEFVDDFNLMMDNCTYFNPPDTIYYRSAVKLKKWARPFLDRVPRGASTMLKENSKKDSIGKDENETTKWETPPPTTTKSRHASSTPRSKRKQSNRLNDVKLSKISAGVDNDFVFRLPFTNLDVLTFCSREEQLVIATNGKTKEKRTYRDVLSSHHGIGSISYRQPIEKISYDEHVLKSMTNFIDGMPSRAIKRVCRKFQLFNDKLQMANNTKRTLLIERLKEEKVQLKDSKLYQNKDGDDESVVMSDKGLIVSQEFHTDLAKLKSNFTVGEAFGISQEQIEKVDTLNKDGYEVNIKQKLGAYKLQST